MDSHIPQLLEVIPDTCNIKAISLHTQSPWAKAYRITAVHLDGSDGVYFMKVSEGHHGHEALKGEFEATRQMFTIAPDFCPNPIAKGTFKDESCSHFYICKFYELSDGVPEPNSFCEKVARLHSAHTSPQGKFGFHVTTYNGNLPQDNTWSDSWEECFTNGLKHVFKVYRERAGPQPELEAMLPGFYQKVIPRLLRPLESGGRKLQPSFVHGDLWCGNAAIINEDTGEGIAFDPAGFWAHNEYELGNWRPERNLFSQRYFKAYHSYTPKSAPEEDYDDRNALYSLRFNANGATIFPGRTECFDMVLEEMRRLIKKYPRGLETDE